MFYVEGWMPLVDAMDRVGQALKTRYRAEKRGNEVGSSRFYDDVHAQTWKLCDTCLAGVVAANGNSVYLSPKLFARNSETSQFGDFLSLSIGQLGSGYWRPWYTDAEPEAASRDDFDPTPFVQPYLNAHVMIRDDDVLSDFLTMLAKPTGSTKPARGRPEVQTSFAEVYKVIFPNGHVGLTKQDVINKVNEAGGPRISIPTFDRMIRSMKIGDDAS